MKLVSSDTFDDLQQALTAELIRTIKAELEKVDAPTDLVQQLTGNIAFAVASLIDDVAGFESDGEEVSPVLTFDVGDETLAFSGGSSYMHEHVHKLLPVVFSAEE